MVRKTFGEVCDELTILERKQVAFAAEGRVFPEDSRKRLEELTAELMAFVAERPDKERLVLKYLENLREANYEIWNLESAIRTQKIEGWFPRDDEYYKELGKRAESIRVINARRVGWKNLLNRLAGDAAEVKIQHASAQSPRPAPGSVGRPASGKDEH